MKMAHANKWFLPALLALVTLNLGLVLKGPAPLVAQQCPDERSDCRSGVEECGPCGGCLCWTCGRDCGDIG